MGDRPRKAKIGKDADLDEDLENANRVFKLQKKELLELDSAAMAIFILSFIALNRRV